MYTTQGTRKKKMFEAMVLVCLMGDLNNCFAADDTRGPYKTINECIDRTTEMSAQLLTINKDHVVMGVRCDPVKPSGVET